MPGAVPLDRVPETTTVTLQPPHAPGYLYRSGGEVSLNGEGFHVTDVIFIPLTVKLSGRVVDAGQHPVAGAQVMALHPVQRTVTTAGGLFTLTTMPEGEVTLVAALGKAAALMTAQTGKAPITITLTPAHTAPPGDIQRAVALACNLIADNKSRDIACQTLPFALAAPATLTWHWSLPVWIIGHSRITSRRLSRGCPRSTRSMPPHWSL